MLLAKKLPIQGQILYLDVVHRPPARRSRFWHQRASGLPGGPSELERRVGVLPLEGRTAAHRGGVGVGCPGGAAGYVA